MRLSLNPFLQAAGIRLGLPRLSDGADRHGGDAANGHFEVAVHGQLKIRIQHDGGDLEQRFPIDPREPLTLTLHSLAGPMAEPVARSQPMLKLTVSNLWTLLFLRVRRVLRLRRVPSIGIFRERVSLQPLPSDMRGPLPSDTNLSQLARSSAMDAVKLELTSVDVPRIAPISLRFQGTDLADMLTSTAQIDHCLPLATLSVVPCYFDGILNSPCRWDAIRALDKART